MTFFYLVKDYIEVVHKLIETSPSHVLQHSTYTDSLTILSFGLSSFKQLCINFLSFEWLKQLWYFPIIVPEIARSMMEEISVLDGNFHNILTFLDKPIAVGNEVYGNYYLPLTCLEKIFTGLINSMFIWLPTSTATFICFRRFIMQGVEAGYSAALGTMAATLFWLTSIIFGLRFIVVPWMSLDLFRYWLGFLLLMKYFWDNRYAYKEVKHNSVFGKQTRRNIFAFHFLLALTEQTSLYPFLSNLSISSQSTLLEGFPSENILDFTLIHFSYLLGIAIGSYSLINLLSWFWQDPAYRFYFWIMNKFKKLRVADIVRPVHLFFQSITVLFAFSSLPNFGIEYQVTNPLGFVPNDQVFHQFKQTSFLTHSTSPAYYRSRLNFPRQKFFRYEDWAEYYHRNTPIDTSLYDQGAYRLYTMEDLSYGKDYEWMRRRSDKIKIRSRLKRLRWFPRNWANRLWEFTKTWSRRNVLWRNDILNMYQYSWDSKAPIIWNKLVFEEFFPTSSPKVNGNTSNKPELNNGKVWENLNNNGTPIREDPQSTKENVLASNKSISKSWDSFWGPDPDWTTKFLANQQSLTNTDQKFSLNSLSRFNVSDNDAWWKWLSNQTDSKTSPWDFSLKSNSQDNFLEKAENLRFSKKIQKPDFWEPQNRLISIYSENANLQKNELNLEFSTLRKFVRKLTARLKLANINKVSQKSWEISNSENKAIPLWYKNNNFSSNSLKTLLITPTLRDWTVFQTLLANINSVLWWRRFSNTQFQLMDPYEKSKKQSPAFTVLAKNTYFSSDKQKTWQSAQSLLQAGQNQENLTKFEKIQKKYLEIQNRRNFLINEMNSSQTKNILTANEQEKLTWVQPIELASNLKGLKSKLILNNSQKFNPNINSINLKNKNLFLFQNKNNSNIMKLDLPSVESSSILLHPVKYYLHKEQNFKRKLNFYGVKNRRNSALNDNSSTTVFNKNFQSISSLQDTEKIAGKLISSSSNLDNQNLLFLKNKNKLPIFNFYLKTYFQTYKKTKLYVLNTKMKRQLGMGASARRKGRDYSNKLLKRAKILSNTPWIRQWIDQSGFLARRKRLETWIARQHYDPNELWAKIMKTDVDLFMKRQPSSYFLTNTEENLLHLRRFLLFEYYDTLRWYTYMTNYRSMKNTIGGTKSFTNKLYNQQFKGTFHKVRHLFSLTPSSSNGSLLKFDRPLYNFDQFNKFSSVPYQNGASWDHEELRTDTNEVGMSPGNDTPLDLLEQSTKNLQQSLWQNNLMRQNYISYLLEQKNTESANQAYTDANNSTLLTTLVLNENSNIAFPVPKLSLDKSSQFSPILGSTRVNSQSEIIKNNLQKRLMMRILQSKTFENSNNIFLFRKKQKWTIDYKRASEKLWKKWKLRSTVQEPQPISVSTSVTGSDQLVGNTLFSPLNKIDSQQNSSLLSQKLLQIKKLELFEATNIRANVPATTSLNSMISMKQNQENKKFNRQLNFGKIFKQNIFTRKLITEKYNKLVKQNFLQIQNIKGKSIKNSEKAFFSTFGDLLKGVRSWNFKIKKIISNRTINISRTSIQKESSRGKTWEMSKLSTDLATQNNIQLYEINKIRQERSNIQNFVFRKKFLVNDNFTALTRSQLRPLPGKRTKALYDKLGSSKANVGKGLLAANRSDLRSGSVSGFYQYFLSSISDKDGKILFYKNRNWLNSLTQDEKLSVNKMLSARESEDGTSKSDLSAISLRRQDNLSLLNSKWKVVVNTIKNSPELVANKLDKNLQTKLIQDQNEKMLTKDIQKQSVKGTISLDSSTSNLKPQKSEFFEATTSALRDSSGFKNIAIQKLTKTLLSKQKSLNSLEKPITSRITKAARKRQQDSVTRSLLKRHLNLKSRRKLFLKTKEINNQRMVLDRKYEIQERVFLNQIGFLSEFKNGLQGSELMINAQKDSQFKFENKYNLNSKNFVKGNTVSESSSFAEARASTSPFSRWVKLAKNSKFLLVNPENKFVGSRGVWENSPGRDKNSSSALSLSATWKNQAELNTILLDSEIGVSSSQQQNSNVALKQSYLSSTKRSTLFIDKILNQHKNEYNKNYLTNKLNQNFGNSWVLEKLQFSPNPLDGGSTIENEKSSLRRSLRKFSLGNSVPFTNEKLKILSTNSKVKKTETSFINNLLLKNWLMRRPVLPFSNQGADSVQLTNLSSRNLLDKVNKKSETGLINLNKYIIFARTNQNKLSRQQIRKKLKKRRIVRMKRTERLKTLKDHPLKFRSDQIQTFYNIRDSLKKWKDFSFISEKNQYTKSFFLPLDETSGQLSSLNTTKNYQNVRYKPLNLFQKEKTTENQLFTQETNRLNWDLVGDSNRQENLRFSLQTLYKDIFINSSEKNMAEPLPPSFGPKREILDLKTDSKPLVVNTINMPFYAGWDDTLRKFVLTNRLLNRREAGYQTSEIAWSNSLLQDNNESKQSRAFTEIEKNSLNKENNIVFSLWPLKGTNSATTLFSQFPFMTAPQTNLTYSQSQIRSIKSGTKYDLQNSINFNKLSNQKTNDSEKSLVIFDNKWKQKSSEIDKGQGDSRNKSQSNFLGESNYLNFKKMNRIKTFIKSSKTDEQIGIRQSGQVISNLASSTTRKMARQALFAGRAGSTNFKNLKFLNQLNRPRSNNDGTDTNSQIFNQNSNWNSSNSQSIDRKLSTKILLLRNLRQGNRAQTKLAYIRRLQKTLRPTGSSWKTTMVLSRRKKQRMKYNNFWGMPQNEASTRFSVRKRKKRGNNKNPRLRGDKNYKKTKRQYRQKLYLRPKNKPLRRRSLGVTFKNKLNYWRRNYQSLSLKNNNSQTRSVILSQNLNDNSRYSQIDKEWNFLNKFQQKGETEKAGETLFLGSSITRKPRQLYRSLFKNPPLQTQILYTTLPGHSRSIPLIKNLPLPGSSVKTLNRVIKWSSADGASRFYRVNLSYGWAMTLFLNNLRQKVNSENTSSVNTLIKEYLTELEKTNKMKFSSAREFKRRFYKLRQLSYTMSLRLYDRWFFYYYKTTTPKPGESWENSGSRTRNEFDLDSIYMDQGDQLTTNKKLETNIHNKIKQSILASSVSNPIEQSLSPFKHIKKFLTFHISFSRKEKELENQTNFRSYLKNLRNTAYSKTQPSPTEIKQTVEKTNKVDENIQSKTSSGILDQEYSSLSTGENGKTKELLGLDNFKLFPTENKDETLNKSSTFSFENSTLTNLGNPNIMGGSDKKENQNPRNTVKSNKTLLKKEKKYAEDRFFFAQFNKPPLVDNYRLTLENNRHYPLNGGFVWPGDYLRLQTILLPKEIKDLYLVHKNTTTQFLKDKKNDHDFVSN